MRKKFQQKYTLRLIKNKTQNKNFIINVTKIFKHKLRSLITTCTTKTTKERDQRNYFLCFGQSLPMTKRLSLNVDIFKKRKRQLWRHRHGRHTLKL